MYPRELTPFLSAVKSAVTSRKIMLLPREQNKETRYKLGLTVDDLYDLIINQINFCDYNHGPEPSKNINHRGQVWTFLKQHRCPDLRVVELYIKLSFTNDDYNDTLLIISFKISK